MKDRIRKNKYLLTGLYGCGILIGFAVLVPLLSSYSYSDQNASIQNMGSSFAHLFGTDKFGRDIFVRVFYGTRISLLVGVLSAGICGGFGILYGAFSGYQGGMADMICMRLADIIDAIPSLLYVILITLTVGANVTGIIIGICISGWIEIARIVRGEVLKIKHKEFCIAAKLAGGNSFYIICKHVLPNAAGAIIVNLTFFVPKSIFTEAFLSFMGVGIAAPIASLGSLIHEARSQMRIYPYQMIYPILVLCSLMICFQMLGMGLEKYLKVKER